MTQRLNWTDDPASFPHVNISCPTIICLKVSLQFKVSSFQLWHLIDPLLSPKKLYPYCYNHNRVADSYKLCYLTSYVSILSDLIFTISSELGSVITIYWTRKWQPTPVFLPGKSHGQRSLVGYSPWGRKELDMIERLHLHHLHHQLLTHVLGEATEAQFIIIRNLLQYQL